MIEQHCGLFLASKGLCNMLPFLLSRNDAPIFLIDTQHAI